MGVSSWGPGEEEAEVDPDDSFDAELGPGAGLSPPERRLVALGGLSRSQAAQAVGRRYAEARGLGAAPAQAPGGMTRAEAVRALKQRSRPASASASAPAPASASASASAAGRPAVSARLLAPTAASRSKSPPKEAAPGARAGPKAAKARKGTRAAARRRAEAEAAAEEDRERARLTTEAGIEGWAVFPETGSPVACSMDPSITQIVNQAAQLTVRSADPELGGLRADLRRSFEDLDVGGGAGAEKLRAEQLELQQKAAQLQAEMRKVAEHKLRLSMKAEEQKLRAHAKDQLEHYERHVAKELEDKVVGLVDERKAKIAEVATFREQVAEKINALHQVLGQLQRRQDNLESAYDAAVAEIRSEYTQALAGEKQRLETDVRQRLGKHLQKLKGLGVQLAFGGGPPAAAAAPP